ncbi:Regulator of protease activity HflC, stomatin/prohibitin superfamily [Halogranum amylolyticum]|uniref:Regulator of protease activity HflC, stomatin/prohibitin superfamily n=1 Tax=Halogranum amylolyticum TaxID=660520 RepID=A0A1H8QRV5_9EURY|nr:prohibitin family protein [Halogranum amylolyticum]SEO57000.1 Regulator of protease activity HflC, stomatin/prohibitin superfamily [Halogranum amylolyticum]
MSTDPDPPRIGPDNLRRTAVVGLLALLLLAAPVAGLLAWEPVDEGNVKVVKKWGATTGTVFEPGAHFVNPVSQSTSSLSVRPQSYTMSAQQNEGQQSGDDAIRVLTEDGLRTDIDVTVRYRVDAGKAVNFYRKYRTLDTAEERLIRPSIRSVLRTEAGRLPVTEIYTGEGQTKLKLAAEQELADEFSNDGLILEAVQIRNVELPAEYAKAVEQKEITEQRRQQKQSELEVEKLEADRKEIEAQGEAEANRIVSESLTDEVLAQQYIQRLDETDTVYIPVGGDGYPQFVRNLESDSEAGSSGSTTTGQSSGNSSTDSTQS